jgi:N-formylglutamate amidohydrolase
LVPDKAIAGRFSLRNNVDRGVTMNDKDRPMPPLIAFAGALGGLAVVRWAYRTALRVNRELEEARLARVAEAARSGDIPTLRRDPATGAYRPG